MQSDSLSLNTVTVEQQRLVFRVPEKLCHRHSWLVEIFQPKVDICAPKDMGRFKSSIRALGCGTHKRFQLGSDRSESRERMRLRLRGLCLHYQELAEAAARFVTDF